MRIALPVLGALALCAASSLQAQPKPLSFIDAHSHYDEASGDEEIATFRRAGLAGVIIMDPEPGRLQALAKRNRGYVAPFYSIARTPQMKGERLGPTSAATLGKARDAGEVCGFGEIPTRIEPRTSTDDVALEGADRRQVYAAANARRTPVSLHVSLETPAVTAAIDRTASAYPDMPLILAHAGWVAGADVIGALLAAHPNLYADLSIRLDPAKPENANDISILTADGALKPEWRALIARYPDRFLFAMDVSGADREKRVPELLAVATKALSPLPRKVQEQVAGGNTLKLLHGCGGLHG